jgi:hypothetical protein
MARVVFTPNIQRHLECPPFETGAKTVQEALAACFAQNPRAKSYVLDDQGAVRKHMAIFVDGGLILDRERLSDPITDDSEVFVMQALSGGQLPGAGASISAK